MGLMTNVRFRESQSLDDRRVNETQARKFHDAADLREHAGTNDWWIPDFLPRSGRSITYKVNLDYMSGIFLIHFDPAEVKSFEARLSDVSNAEWADVAPRWVYSSAGVFPKEIIRGDLHSLKEWGFRVASVAPLYGQGGT